MIKLTDMDGTVVYVNPKALAYMLPEEGGTYFSLRDSSTFRVKETPEEILALINGPAISFEPLDTGLDWAALQQIRVASRGNDG